MCKLSVLSYIRLILFTGPISTVQIFLKFVFSYYGDKSVHSWYKNRVLVYILGSFGKYDTGTMNEDFVQELYIFHFCFRVLCWQWQFFEKQSTISVDIKGIKK